ncbi:host cell division inhibitor Icd-like protein [Salmonella enterica]|nr:host cell division inhibitor Icd-like protein [Salmonella enterica]EBQ2127380.1 host cell division inhibitor Icd-like protein [Salmonella enterica]EBT1279341.1 host cell division inhibitor Icd-like protein [Salmonella enterica]EGA3604854.1 host cell division inhibitor Icd-like protein [Salmonella enterica]MIV19592.1 host cell division inhibitor Icd-like protein [Salmonella enterica]
MTMSLYPKYEYRFMALSRASITAVPCRLSVEASSEQEARKILAPNFILVFAARLPVRSQITDINILKLNSVKNEAVMNKVNKNPASRKNGPEVLAYLGAVLSEHLSKSGIPEDKTDQIVLDVMDVMKFEFGGQVIYFPRGHVIKADERGEEIYAAYRSGKAIPNIAHDFGCSIQWVYQLIARVRAKRRAEMDKEIEERKNLEINRWKRENLR